jgi:hypothetical protein
VEKIDDEKQFDFAPRAYCPDSAGITVRFTQESLSALCKNKCPVYARTTVRIGQESLSGLGKNMQHISKQSEIVNNASINDTI